MHPALVVSLPPGPGPNEPRSPRVAVTYILPVLGDEPLRVAEIRGVVASPRCGATMPVEGDVHDVSGGLRRSWEAGGLVARHAGGDLLDLFHLERRLTALLVCYPERCQDLRLAHAAPTHSPGKAGESVVALPRGYALPHRPYHLGRHRTWRTLPQS